MFIYLISTDVVVFLLAGTDFYPSYRCFISWWKWKFTHITTRFLLSLTFVHLSVWFAREAELISQDEQGGSVLTVSVKAEPGRVPRLVWELSSSGSHHLRAKWEGATIGSQQVDRSEDSLWVDIVTFYPSLYSRLYFFFLFFFFLWYG